jgi:hypothetical protein
MAHKGKTFFQWHKIEHFFQAHNKGRSILNINSLGTLQKAHKKGMHALQLSGWSVFLK